MSIKITVGWLVAGRLDAQCAVHRGQEPDVGRLAMSCSTSVMFAGLSST